MKKKVVFGVLILSILLVMSTSFFVLAQEDEENGDAELSSEEIEKQNIDNAYDCLEEKVEGRCASLNTEERIFSLLAIGECKGEVKADSKANECWPKSSCKIKTTAQAILALEKAGEDTTNAQDWIYSKIIPATKDLDWYLQIDSSEETICSITYQNRSHDITIRKDKTISSSAGVCLSVSEGGWWLKISPTCLEETFEISCDKAFLTTLLFRQKGASTIHVSENVHMEAEGGTTTEKVSSFCFSEDGSNCDYEGSLWAALMFQNIEKDIKAYLPYLVTGVTRNNEYLPEAFLYSLTGYTDFRANLMLKQKPPKYWDESGDKFYDTAVALYPFTSEDFSEKTNAKEWLFANQDDSGCFGGIRNTAFLLHSIWPKTIASAPDDIDCGEAGYFCMSMMDCDGNILNGYSCPGLSMCCDSQSVPDPCAEQAGEVCNSEQMCVGGVTVEASDLGLGETCCVEGRCEIPTEPEPEISECESSGGTCKPFGCDTETETEEVYNCPYGDTCCILKPAEEKSYWWIWVLLILIVLAVLGIIFREKLRPYYIKIKKIIEDKLKKKPGKPSGPGIGMPGGPRPPGMIPPAGRTPPGRPLSGPPRGMPPRRPGARPPMRRPGQASDVLKKLRDMGK